MIYKLEGNHVPYIPSADWSRDFAMTESDWTHEKSKLVGGTGVLTLATAGLGTGAAGSGAAASQTGTIVVQAEGQLAVATAGMAVPPGATAAAAAGMGVGTIGQMVQMSGGGPSPPGGPIHTTVTKPDAEATAMAEAWKQGQATRPIIDRASGKVIGEITAHGNRSHQVPPYG